LGGAPLGGIEQEPPVAAAPRRTLGLRRIALGLMALGGIAVVVGSFLPWVTADILSMGIRTGSGWVNVQGNLSYGPALATVGTVLVILALFEWQQRTRGARWFAVAALLAGAVVLTLQYVDVLKSHAALVAAPRYGLVVCAVGLGVSLAALVCSAVARS
jgi:hypothetical protein